MAATKARLRRAERAQRGQRPRPDFGRRRAVLGALLSLAFATVLASAFYRQVVETDFLQHEGERRFLREREIPARRGLVLDRNGEPLAISTAVATFTADPRVLANRTDAMPALADALDLDAAKLQAQLIANRERAFLYLRRRVEHQLVDTVTAAVERYDLAGIGIETEYRRFYPGGEMFGQVIGFTDIDDQGQEGIELLYNNRLKATPGKRRVIQDGLARVVEEVEQLSPPRHGEDLRLSLDRRLQFLAYRELKRAVLEHQAAGGSAALLDVATGEVLALVNQPSFNPNSPRTEDAAQRRNRALTDVFEPGSTVKPFVVAMALEAGVLSPTTPINTAPGYLAVGRNRVRDIHNYGLLDTTSVITKSSNVGVVKIAQQLDRAVLWQLYRRLGFGQPTAVGFPGERAGFLSHYEGWSAFEHATLAFGYGLNVTTLQLAQAYAVLAADGLHRPVSLLKTGARPDARRILAPRHAATVRAMMETVVSNEGTARRAAVDGYRIAGKTGTAKKAGPGGYLPGKYQSVFAGLAPASTPRFVMVVMIDEPGGKSYYGGTVAAPVFAKVMQAALRLYNVPPDQAGQSLLLATGAEAQP